VVRDQNKSKAFKPLLQEFRGPSMLPIDTLGVRGNFLTFRGSTEQKKLRTPDLYQLNPIAL